MNAEIVTIDDVLNGVLNISCLEFPDGCTWMYVKDISQVHGFIVVQKILKVLNLVKVPNSSLD